MANANALILLGIVEEKPEMRYTRSGKALCELKVAVERESGVVDHLPVIVWNRDAEACQMFLDKGSIVHVTGRLQSRNYETPEGQKRVAIEILSEEIEFIQQKKSV